MGVGLPTAQSVRYRQKIGGGGGTDGDVERQTGSAGGPVGW